LRSSCDVGDVGYLFGPSARSGLVSTASSSASPTGISISLAGNGTQFARLHFGDERLHRRIEGFARLVVVDAQRPLLPGNSVGVAAVTVLQSYDVPEPWSVKAGIGQRLFVDALSQS
jgi:hypothetical protein